MGDSGEVLVHLEYLREKADETTDHLGRLNGRTRKSEMAIAVLQWAVGLIGIVSLALFGAFLNKVWP